MIGFVHILLNHRLKFVIIYTQKIKNNEYYTSHQHWALLFTITFYWQTKPKTNPWLENCTQPSVGSKRNTPNYWVVKQPMLGFFKPKCWLVLTHRWVKYRHFYSVTLTQEFYQQEVMFQWLFFINSQPYEKHAGIKERIRLQESTNSMTHMEPSNNSRSTAVLYILLWSRF